MFWMVWPSRISRLNSARNWRKVGEGDQYPRYERIRESFEEDFSTFAAFLRRQDLGELKLNQCEVTYVDHVVAGEGWERHGQVDEVATLWAKRQADGFLPEPENVRFAVRYVIQIGRASCRERV